MSIMTVIGEVKAENFGKTLPHEHLKIDLRKLVDAPVEDNGVFFRKMKPEIRYTVYSDPYSVLDNAVYSSYKMMLEELEIYKSFGGKSIVDVTLDEIGRDPLFLKRLSLDSGVNIVMGCGYYLGALHGEKLKNAPVREIAEKMIRDIFYGVGNTGVKAGVIGEIGTSACITESEYKCVDAAGIACVETGKAIHFHTSLWERNGLEIVKRLCSKGVPSEKICINHVDVNLREDYVIALMDQGAYVEFDNFGKEFFIPARADGVLKGRFAYDLERCELIKKLVDKGYEKRILISNDICLKSMFCHYGGNGFGHVFSTVETMLADCGISQNTIKNLTEINPVVFLEG